MHVIGVADTPGLTASLGTATEDGNMSLNIAGTLVDTDDSESLSYTVAGVPDGFSLTGGTYDSATNTWSLTPDQLDSLQLVPPDDYSGRVDLTVTVTTTEQDGDTDSVSTVVSGTFTPVADAPDVTVGDVSGFEDNAIGLNLGAVLTDPSETLSVVISGVPDGATFSSGTKHPDGTWSIDPTDLAGLTVTPPDDFSGDMGMTITATSTESDGSTAQTNHDFNVHVTGVADTPDLAVTPATGAEDSAVPLSITPALNDADGSEALSVTVSDIPDGFTLSAGTLNADGNRDPDSGPVVRPDNFRSPGLFRKF